MCQKRECILHCTPSGSSTCLAVTISTRLSLITTSSGMADSPASFPCSTQSSRRPPRPPQSLVKRTAYGGVCDVRPRRSVASYSLASKTISRQSKWFSPHPQSLPNLKHNLDIRNRIPYWTRITAKPSFASLCLTFSTVDLDLVDVSVHLCDLQITSRRICRRSHLHLCYILYMYQHFQMSHKCSRSRAVIVALLLTKFDACAPVQIELHIDITNNISPLYPSTTTLGPFRPQDWPKTPEQARRRVCHPRPAPGR